MVDVFEAPDGAVVHGKELATEFVRSGSSVLVHTQKIGIQSEKPTWTKALEFTQFACPCGIDPRLLSGEQRTSH
jgi:hypothetical protein